MGVGEVGLEPDRFAEFGDRRGDITFGIERPGEFKGVEGRSRFQTDMPLGGGDRRVNNMVSFLDPAPRLQQLSEAIEMAGLARVVAASGRGRR